MKYSSFPVLTWSLFSKYSGRKQAGFINVFVDVNANEIIPIPRDIEHITFVAEILNCDIQEIKENPAKCSHLVPSIIQISGDYVISVVTGVSGLEIAFKVRHKKEHLQIAHSLVWAFIENGEIPIGNLVENTIVERYAIKE